MELRLKTPGKYLFSSFETVHWYAAAGLIDELKSKPINVVFPRVISSRLTATLLSRLDLDDSGEKKPQFLIDGIHILLDKLKSWVGKKNVSARCRCKTRGLNTYILNNSA